MDNDGWTEPRPADTTENKLLRYNVHTPLQNMPLERVRAIAEATALPCALMLYTLTGDINVGMAIRTAAILGCSDVYIVGRRKYDRRSEVGARNYIKLWRHSEIADDFFEKQGLVPILVEQGGTPLEEMNFKKWLPGQLGGKKVVFVVGSEANGLPAAFINRLKAPVVSISQYGVMRSLNVAVAASIVLYEYTKQWRAARVAII